MSVRLVPMTDELVEPVCNAYARALADARRPGVWRHIYGESPDGAMGLAALDGTENVIGHFGATLHRVARPGHKAALFAQIRDVFASPSALGKETGRGSVFEGLGQTFLEQVAASGVSVIFGFGCDRHYGLGAQLLGQGHFTGLRVWKREIPVPGAAIEGRLGAITTVTGFEDDVDSLLERRQLVESVLVPRRAVFLNWRFSPRTGKKYVRYRYDSILAGGIAGYAVVAHDAQEARLVDFHFPENADLRMDMWHQLAGFIGRTGARSVTLFASSAVPESACLASLGFVPLTEQQSWFPAYMSLVPEWANSNLGGMFHMTMADGDIS